MKKFSKILNWTLVVLGTLVLIMFIGGGLSNTESKNEDFSNKTIEEIAKEKYTKDFKSLEIEGSNDYILNVNMSENFSNNLRLYKFKSDFIEFIEDIKDKGFNSITIVAYVDGQDKYGNINEMIGSIIKVSHDEINKINFDNFVLENFEKISEKYYVHPGLLK